MKYKIKKSFGFLSFPLIVCLCLARGNWDSQKTKIDFSCHSSTVEEEVRRKSLEFKFDFKLFVREAARPFRHILKSFEYLFYNMIKCHLGTRKLIKRLMSPDRYTILFKFLRKHFRLSKKLKATNFYYDFGIITTTDAVIVEHTGVTLVIVTVIVVLMSHWVWWKA